MVLWSLAMGNNLGKIPKLQRKHLLSDFGLMLPYTLTTATSAFILALSAHWVDLLIIFENSVIFVVLSSSKTLMAPYFRAKFLCLAFKALKKIGPICSAQGWISHSAKTVSWLAHKYSTLLDILPWWCLFPCYVNYLFFLSTFQMTGVN